MSQVGSLVPKIALNDGTAIPQLGFGTLGVQPDREPSHANIETTASVVGLALSAGYRHIDTAQSYGTEAGIGRAIAESGVPRDDLYVTSKLADGNHHPDEVRRSFDATLAGLGLEYLDLFLIHWPLPARYGGDYVSTWRAVTGLVTEGRLRTAGVSNFQPAHLARLVTETGIRPAVNQVEIHPYFGNAAVTAAAGQHGTATEAHSPLGRNGESLRDDTITRVAASHGRSAAQVILRWHVQHGRITIPKSSRPARMADNLQVFDFELTARELASIDALDRGPRGRVGPDPDTYEGR
jgi:2,5-diketo-D-gluconate reductase A